ncbi:hypothetical protein ACN47E_000699 [Coniothyrium glycines]
MTDRKITPPAQNSSTMSVTPGRRRHERILPPSTPRSSLTPLPNHAPYTPGSTTPGGSVLPCTTEETLFTIVTVHTAKCTECDKRNMDTMRRCPGCTFQVCTPCFERRQRAGRGLVHGTMTNVNGGTPVTQRTVRNKPVASTPISSKVQEQKRRQSDGVTGRGSSSITEKMISTGKAGGKRTMLCKRPQAADPDSDDTLSDVNEDFFSGSPSPTLNKRRRPTLNLDGSLMSPTTRSNSKRLLPLPLAPQLRFRQVALDTHLVPTTLMNITPGQLSINRLMHVFKVNTAENPYEAHLLSRHEPVVSNPVIRVPDVVRRGFKPRPSQQAIQKNIQEKVLQKIRERNVQYQEEQQVRAGSFRDTEPATQEQERGEEADSKHTVVDQCDVIRQKTA